MKKYLTISLLILSFPLLAEPNLNNKTPVPTIEAAQRSGLYEGVETKNTLPKKEILHEQEMEDTVDEQANKPSQEQRHFLNPAP